MDRTTTRRTIVTAAVALVGGGVVARTLAQSGTPPADASATPDASPMASPTAGIPVAIAQYKFVPQALEVVVGDTVTWMQEDIIGHTATAKDGTFASEVLGRGDTYSFTFTEAGTHDYICALHPGMTGTITVR